MLNVVLRALANRSKVITSINGESRMEKPRNVEALKKCFNIKEEREALNSHRYSEAARLVTLPDWPARLAVSTRLAQYLPDWRNICQTGAMMAQYNYYGAIVQNMGKTLWKPHNIQHSPHSGTAKTNKQNKTKQNKNNGPECKL
jgi:hypothetical protein